ncbi:TetR family transcriptional regulator [Modestobacter sp. I12A-02628]|uniref:TetR/AcrR family transcriptional regulator n=1 Tax=Goekera deserti TaxID=2497753 RepID=A0A7K3WDJ4_9ACTN|nr:TetR/AcrR family transcriptional regulator [Goekera deserti]MPQ97561.1 TetR family transcriptional regulator [Goekera deserti]NDI47835.1 TetR family transcriptional regulator [Goekera deserti]NEL53583.1 TetR/AcrR family transcriptional regulator [Goekera deserti]
MAAHPGDAGPRTRSGAAAPTGQDDGCASARPLRADAERNRRRVLAVAMDVFAERGLDAGFDEIARRAGVGVGTVYRRFPRREDLVVALFEDRLQAVIGIGQAAALDPDPWTGLLGFVTGMVELQVSDRGLREVISQTAPLPSAFRESIDRVHAVAGDLLERAQRAGVVRSDVAVSDLVALTGMLTAVAGPDVPELWRRYAALVAAGLRADGAPRAPLPLAPPDPDELDHLMRLACGRRPQP